VEAEAAAGGDGSRMMVLVVVVGHATRPSGGVRRTNVPKRRRNATRPNSRRRPRRYARGCGVAGAFVVGWCLGALSQPGEWTWQDEAARKQEEDRAARKASVEAERQRRGDAIFVPFVDAHTPEDSQVRLLSG